MNTVHMVDQAPRHDCAPDGPAAKLARARAYLAERNICCVTPGNELRYTEAAKGSRVLRSLRKKAA